MTIEALASLWSGIVAGSLTVTAFGLDSVIELASSCVLVWRLNVELQRNQEVAETTERRASRTAGGLLFLLAAYIIVAAAWTLWTRQGKAFTRVGLAVALLALPIMYFLSRRKLAVAALLGSRALRADAVESITCGWLALVVVIGLFFDLLLQAWWVDAVTSLTITGFVVKEAHEAWNAEECCDRVVRQQGEAECCHGANVFCGYQPSARRWPGVPSRSKRSKPPRKPRRRSRRLLHNIRITRRTCRCAACVNSISLRVAKQDRA